MDNNKRLLLQHYQSDIIKDLEVEYLTDELFSKHAITADDIERLNAKTTRTDRARCLIDLLLQNGTNASYDAFVDSLAKDYKWLWNKLSVDNNEPIMNESFEDSLSRGNVPRLPDHYVERTALEFEVTQKLSQLTRHKILVLHGMSGSGKTSLVISVLRHNSDLVNNNFNGSVFWYNLSNCKTEDDIVTQQNLLYRKASSIYTRNSFVNSSMLMSSFGSNLDAQSSSSYEWKWQHLRDRLNSAFSEKVLRDSLLVLDEVNEKLCVEAFDIGCKILITTRDSEVVADLQPHIIEIENNLEEKETLKLLASYLDIEVRQLPEQAKKLHHACKGSPFNLSLIGAVLAENKKKLLHNNKHWNSFLKKLEKKDFIKYWRSNYNPMKTIEVCVISLTADILSLFKMLAILPDNVKVSAKVLSKLWNKEICDVESIMKKLRSKSLIIETYDHDQKNYIYEVHDLIMNYLRSQVVEEERINLHCNLLKSYHYDSNNPPLEIIDDGYIAFYVGYHILSTCNMNDWWKLFNKLYLDLKFIGNKVRLTGPADVILDLQKYENYIVKDDLDFDLLNRIKAFLSTYGIDLYRYPCTDIVQSILQHESQGLLYTKASEIAQKNCSKNELYFEFIHEQDVEEVRHSTIDVKEMITSVCFLGDYVLAGTVTGVIKFFHIPTNKLKKEITGTGSSIKWVGACPNRPQVAALTNDGFIILWYIDAFEHEDTDEIIEEESEEHYNNNYPNNYTISPKMGAFINCRWSNNEETLITHTSKMIIIYNYDGKVLKVFDNFDKEQDILCCTPCNNDRYIITAVANNGNNSLMAIDQTNKEKVMFLDETDTVLNILTVPGSDRIITLKSKEITVHEYRIKYHNNCHTRRCNNLLSAKDIKDNLLFLAIAVNKTGTLLFVSTDDSRIICVDLKTNLRAFDLENRRGNVFCMDVIDVAWNDFEAGSDVLLTGTGTVENCIKVWNLDASYVLQTTQKNGKVRLTKKFDVSFLNHQSPQSPSTSTSSSKQSVTNSPRRNQSFVNHTEAPKRPVVTSLSLDRHALKPLNLKGICNNNDGTYQPLLAVIDDKNNIQVMRGRKILAEITTQPDEKVTTIKISPCNHYIFYGLHSGSVKRYALRSKETKEIIDMYDSVQYLNFVNPHLLIAGSKSCCLMAYRLKNDGTWKTDMVQPGRTNLGSTEIINDLQGVKKKSLPIQSEQMSSSDSENSLNFKNRVFCNGDCVGKTRNYSGLLDCFWLKDTGLLTVESNAVVKLWDLDLNLVGVLNARQPDVYVTCAAFQKNILVLCDECNTSFQTYELKQDEHLELSLIQDYRLNNRIITCDLTADGLILAMGLESGEVVIWNVPRKSQLRLLSHHKTAVQCCAFSPVPDKLFRSSVSSPSPFNQASNVDSTDDDSPPLVLVTIASEIVWWNVSYILKIRANKSYWRTGRNVMTPLTSPIDGKSDLTESMEGLRLESTGNNFFFGNGLSISQECWKTIWKNKKYKEGSKKKEILACIKLSGINAKKLCHDDKFSCFVTVDNSGRVHIMNVMKS